MIGKVQRRDGELIVVIPEDVAKAEGIEEGCEVIVRRAFPIDTDWGPEVGDEIIEY